MLDPVHIPKTQTLFLCLLPHEHWNSPRKQATLTVHQSRIAGEMAMFANEGPGGAGSHASTRFGIGEIAIFAIPARNGVGWACFLPPTLLHQKLKLELRLK